MREGAHLPGATVRVAYSQALVRLTSLGAFRDVNNAIKVNTAMGAIKPGQQTNSSALCANDFVNSVK